MTLAANYDYNSYQPTDQATCELGHMEMEPELASHSQCLQINKMLHSPLKLITLTKQSTNNAEGKL